MAKDDEREAEIRAICAARLKQLRELSDKTQDIVAAEIGVSKSTYSSWETGRNRFKITQVPALCTALGCTPNDLFGITEDSRPHPSVVANVVFDQDEVDHLRLYRRSDPAVRQGVNTILRATAKVRPPRSRG